jgi:hypothetical protein
MKSKNFGFLMNKASLNSSVMSIADKLSASLVSLAYSQSPVGLIASLFCATTILIGMHTSENKTLLGIWFGFFLIVTLFRSILATLYKARSQTDNRTVFW